LGASGSFGLGKPYPTLGLLFLTYFACTQDHFDCSISEMDMVQYFTFN